MQGKILTKFEKICNLTTKTKSEIKYQLDSNDIRKQKITIPTDLT